MPLGLRNISYLTPLTHCAEAMRSVASRGWNLWYYQVWFGCLTSFIWSFFFNLIALLMFNISK